MKAKLQRKSLGKFMSLDELVDTGCQKHPETRDLHGCSVGKSASLMAGLDVVGSVQEWLLGELEFPMRTLPNHDFI